MNALTPEQQKAVENAKAAEAKLRAIARTRRPTEAETAEARAAYNAASIALTGKPAEDARG